MGLQDAPEKKEIISNECADTVYVFYNWPVQDSMDIIDLRKGCQSGKSRIFEIKIRFVGEKH